jgi:hypothetical protein
VRRGEGGIGQRRHASDTGCRSEPAFNPHARVEDDREADWWDPTADFIPN